MKKALINNKWELLLPDHRADREELKNWEPERLGKMRSTINYLDVVFDIGSEEGDISALLSKWCEGNIVLFEPSPDYWPSIKAIFDANDLKMLATFNGFVGNRVELNPPDMEDIFNGNTAVNRWPVAALGKLNEKHDFRNLTERYHDTPQITIDHFILMTGIWPTVLNIDVEGSEFEVLKGAEALLRSRNNVKVFVSVHPEFMQFFYKEYQVNLHNYMKGLGYKAEYLAFDHELHYLFLKI